LQQLLRLRVPPQLLHHLLQLLVPLNLVLQFIL
jgi:hypothetical protein